MGRKRNKKETTDTPDFPAGPYPSSSEKDGTPAEPPETEENKPRKRKRRRKRRSGSQAADVQTIVEAEADDSESHDFLPAVPKRSQPVSSETVSDADREPAAAVPETPAPGRRKRRRGGAKNRRKTQHAEIGGQVSDDPRHEAEDEAETVSRAETVRSAGPAVEGSKPRKRRRRRRRGGTQKAAPQSAQGAGVSSGESAPDVIFSGEQGVPEKEAPPVANEPAEARTGQAAEEAADGPHEDAAEHGGVKACLYCGEPKPLGDFLRRTGKRSGRESRRGACRDCRKRRRSQGLEALDAPSDPLPPSDVAQPHEPLPAESEAAESAPKRRIRRPPPEPPEEALSEPTRESELRPTRQGTIRMRGRTDKGRRWQQETDLEMARCLVREHAAVLVNRFTIRRLYTNRSFRRYILERDRYICHFCGEYGDTIDHLLPRAKGGHTTPLNCVCACMLCNQNKADRDLDEFMEDAEPFDALSSENDSSYRSEGR